MLEIKLGGLDPMTVHMFLFYYDNLGLITPPVALGSFVNDFTSTIQRNR